jgi:hypothetical protein
VRRFLHPQLSKIIIARLEEWKSCIVLSSGMQTIWLQIWRRSTLTTIRRTLRKGDGSRTKNLTGTKRTVDSPLLLQIVGQIWPFNPTRRVCVLPHGHRINKRTMEAGLWDIWAFRPDAKVNKLRVINVID